MTEIMFKCEACGKWSHAKRKPKRHQRYVHAKPLDTSLLIEYDPGEYDHMNGQTVEESWRIWCGPFITYYAEPAQPEFAFDYAQEIDDA